MSTLTVAMRLENLGLTQYLSFEFTSGCFFNGANLLAGPDGIVEIDTSGADNTTPIVSFFESGLVEFGKGHISRIRHLVVGFEAENDIRLTVTADNGDSYKTILPATLNDNRQESAMVSVPRSLQGRYWSFRIDNMLGGDFSVDDILVSPVVLPRRPRRGG